MSDLIERAEAAVSAWKAGAITHNLHIELVTLVEEFHAHFSKPVQDQAADPVAVAIPPKEAAPE